MNQKKTSITEILTACQEKLDKKAKETKCENIRVAAICVKQAIGKIEEQRKIDKQVEAAAKSKVKDSL